MSGESSKSTTNSSKTPNISLNRQIILDEDEYTEGLTRIITRDFFPTLHHIQATNEYLSALESQDPALIHASVRTLRDLGPTPVLRRGDMETPLRGRGSETGPNKRRKLNEDDLSLDDYQARFTSEDNASFTEILDEENRQRRERFKWAWEAQRKAMDGKMVEGVNRERMLIEGTGESDARGVGVRPGVRGLITVEKPDVLLITNGDEEKRTTTTEDAPSKDPSLERDVMAPTEDSRVHYISSWNFKTRNGLMFQPDADTSPYHQPPPSSTAVSATNANGGISQPKSITHAGTRLPSPPPTDASPSNAIPPSPTRSRIDAAISGVRYVPSASEQVAEGPNGYNYVPTLPSPSPDQLGPLAMKELMTLGTLLSTPRLLSSTRDGSDNVAPDATPFHIAAPSRREQTGMKLSMKASRSIREKASLLSGSTRTPRPKGDMAPPSATPRKGVSDLTPAARALLARTATGKKMGATGDTPLRNGGLLGDSGVERDLRKVRWTPSPMTRR
ncbi:SubName: Full=Uncharacterized protein {ECO:0000313/EMBL:CCA70719.1} [Serendipita indica DSM 11827]|uniref:Uncharacterized protein n=1 Tax=Serendipita indica (strain DSM 11827) TaxID=1109443 RepID=G4THD3_SERID|nr:SubName: Full=Uncharacterized protein {ECO:0000313/EMBL:CCA70719.1} [Serendipita indica DSM 11827]CCA70719.1 hypothetical protein PIIN_04653 [Serendipita indica DSM 11827]